MSCDWPSFCMQFCVCSLFNAIKCFSSCVSPAEISAVIRTAANHISAVPTAPTEYGRQVLGATSIQVAHCIQLLRWLTSQIRVLLASELKIKTRINIRL
jgi:hypothetical protein